MTLSENVAKHTVLICKTNLMQVWLSTGLSFLPVAFKDLSELNTQNRDFFLLRTQIITLSEHILIL